MEEYSNCSLMHLIEKSFLFSVNSYCQKIRQNLHALEICGKNTKNVAESLVNVNGHILHFPGKEIKYRYSIRLYK